MVVEYDVPPLWTWLFGDPTGLLTARPTPSALASFGTTVVVLLMLALLLSCLVCVIRYGFREGLGIVWKTLCQGVIDLVRISPRRVFGLTGLAVREAFRRQVWVVLAIYVFVLMFAGWNLSSDSPDPAKLYLSFVLQATSYLLMLVALFLAALSLPTDIKNHTIYTVVTKPVRATEILLGRLIGFTIVGTFLLIVMAVASYIFVGRMVNHEHELSAGSMFPVRVQGEVVAYRGRTMIANRHDHVVRVEADSFRPGIAVRGTADGTAAIVTHATSQARETGVQVGDRIVAIDGAKISPTSVKGPAERIRGTAGSTVRLSIEGPTGGDVRPVNLARANASVYTDRVQGHVHLVSVNYDDGQMTYTVGPAQGNLVARVPVYGSLRFRDQDGQFKERGVSVGDIYKYRSYIFGGKLEAAVWAFDELRAEDYPTGLSLDLSVGVFRTHKGKVDQGVRGSLVIQNPETGRQSQEIVFTSQESKLDRIEIPRFMIDSRGNRLDLFQDLVSSDGQVEVWVRCIDVGQFFGMAPADLYIRAPDASYTTNFVKRYVQVWLQMLLVTSLALFCSTFLSGPVSILFTMFVVVIGHKTKYLYHLTQSVIYRDELRVFDALRLGRKPLDEAGLEWIQFQRDRGKSPFVHTTHDGILEARQVGIDRMDNLERVYGGGPLESAYRLFTQENQMSELPREGAFWLMQEVDRLLMHVVQALLNVLPDFERFGTDDYLAHGYNIHASLLSQQACATLAFVVSTMIAGYFLLKTREVAR